MKKGKIRAQALTEIAIFGSLIFFVLLTLLYYARNLREQQLFDQHTFRQAMNNSFTHPFVVEREGEPPVTNYGASLGLSRTLDKQANMLFDGPARRTYGAGVSLYWTGAESPPDVERNEVNSDTLQLPPKLKLRWLRDPTATNTNEEDLRNTALDYIMEMLPLASGFIDLTKSIFPKFIPWWPSWVSPVTKGVTAIYIIGRELYYADKYKTIDDRRLALEGQDEQFAEWGWHVATKQDEKEDPAVKAGRDYVRDSYPQVYDTMVASATDYSTTRQMIEGTTQITNDRAALIRDTVVRAFLVRYDITGQTQPNINSVPPAQRVYAYFPEPIGGTQGLAQDGRYSTQGVGQWVNQRQRWSTPHHQ